MSNSYQPLKKTKILATIGPASRSSVKLEGLLRAGVNGIRLNMSHGTHAEHAETIHMVRSISRKLDKPIAILADLQGPKIRLGRLPEKGLSLTEGQAVELEISSRQYSPNQPIPLQYNIAPYIKPGHNISLRDGMIGLEVTGVKKSVVTAKVLSGGIVFTKQGVNLPQTHLDGNIMTEKDEIDMEFAASQDIDYIGLSFVQTAADITLLRSKLATFNTQIGIIAKIETGVAALHLKEIIKASDGVMVARGDLAAETKPEQVPILQMRIIELAKRYQKIAIVATQMLESMTNSPQPTRAEVSDVATAVMQGADAVMLSGETAIGVYPVETVRLMRRVILYTEENRDHGIEVEGFGTSTKRNAISAAAITLAARIGARIILAETLTGQTARNLCSFRPSVLIVSVTPNRRVYNQMALLWGARAYFVDTDDPSIASYETIKHLKSAHSVVVGEQIIHASGHQTGVTGGTDTLRLEVIT